MKLDLKTFFKNSQTLKNVFASMYLTINNVKYFLKFKFRRC